MAAGPPTRHTPPPLQPQSGYGGRGAQPPTPTQQDTRPTYHWPQTILITSRVCRDVT